MISSPLIVALSASPSPASRTRRLLENVAASLVSRSLRVEVVHLRELSAEALLHAHHGEASVDRALALVEQAAAVVIATPIYKAAYSGLLKTFLDLLPQGGLGGKLVLPLATGGSAAHTLALDYALRPVLAALGARQVLPSIYAVDQQVRWSEDGGLELAPEIVVRLRDGVQQLADALPEPVLTLPSAPPTLRLLKSAALQSC